MTTDFNNNVILCNNLNLAEPPYQKQVAVPHLQLELLAVDHLEPPTTIERSLSKMCTEVESNWGPSNNVCSNSDNDFVDFGDDQGDQSNYIEYSYPETSVHVNQRFLK
ncbi:unnamed protein product [Strongylus vulgaris]|uniref:Uncharacterized protein n=1 Tax=Strongylus vulgaris TaxID=40348 RepID=A0A3P7JXK3_STRVU|nr:unnamed protein product [Strongylus vulgaris]